MANNVKLHEYVGKLLVAVPSASYATNFAVSSDYEIPIDGRRGVLFLANLGSINTGTVDAIVYYASNGVASDAGVDTDVWASSNAVFGQMTSDTSAGVMGLDVDLGSKNLSGGSLYVGLTNTSTAVIGIVAIPYGGNITLPSTNVTDVVTAD